MTASYHLYELTTHARERVAAAARDGEVHPLQPSWYSLSRLLYYSPTDQVFYRELQASDSPSRPSLVFSLDCKADGALTLRWRSPSGTSVGALTFLRAPARALFDAASEDGATQTPYAEDHALFAKLAAGLYRSLVARFEERFALEHESRLILHRSPVASLEVVAADDFAKECSASDARSELEVYTNMRASYVKDAFRRAFCLFPVLHERLEEVSGRALDLARLRALCDTYDAEQPQADERVMSPDNAAYLRATLDTLRQLKAGREGSPEQMASVVGCPPQLVPRFLAELES